MGGLWRVKGQMWKKPTKKKKDKANERLGLLKECVGGVKLTKNIFFAIPSKFWSCSTVHL
jgi:hypothetical protein